MPLSLIVFSSISAIGIVSGVVLLAVYLGFYDAASPVMLWFMFLAFSVLGPSGLMMSVPSAGRALISLGQAYTVLGLAAVGVIFVGALGGRFSFVPVLPLVVLALLALPGGLGLVMAGRASSAGK